MKDSAKANRLIRSDLGAVAASLPAQIRDQIAALDQLIAALERGESATAERIAQNHTSQFGGSGAMPQAIAKPARRPTAKTWLRWLFHSGAH